MDGTIQYTIRPYDTIWMLAQIFNTTVDSIMDLNPGINPRNLFVGQVIKIRPGYRFFPSPQGETTPGTGMTQPGQMAPRPGTTTPRPGMTTPGTGMTQPGTGMTQPGTGMTPPGQMAPRPGTTTPGTGVTPPGQMAPRPGTMTPGAGMTTPGTGVTPPGQMAPRPGTMTPGVGMTTPGTGMTPPGQMAPRPGTMTPGAGMTTPGTGMTQPGTGMTPPGQMAPRPGTMTPGAGMTTPGTGMTPPGQMAPRPGTMTPGAGMTTPGTGMTQPGTGMTPPGQMAPRPGTTTPGAGMTTPGDTGVSADMGYFGDWYNMGTFDDMDGVDEDLEDLNKYFRLLWQQHVYWTRMAIMGIVHDLPDSQLIQQRLLRNPVDFANALLPFYGERVANEFEKLLTDHLTIAAELVTAAKAGDTNAVTDANKRWHDNADSIAELLGSINPYWTVEDWSAMMDEHLQLLSDNAAMMIAGKYEESINAFDDIETQALEMADMMADGIAMQFSEI